MNASASQQPATLSARRRGGFPRIELPAVRQRPRAAFTLIELLVVLAIMAIVVALSVGVGKYLMEESARKETQSTLDIVNTAIYAYFKDQQAWPVEDGNKGTNNLQANLKEVRQCRETISKLSQNAYRKNDKGEYGFYDAWDKPIHYELRGNEQRRWPLLTSAGPDKMFGTESNRSQEQRDRDKEDNLTSDGRSNN